MQKNRNTLKQGMGNGYQVDRRGDGHEDKSIEGNTQRADKWEGKGKGKQAGSQVGRQEGSGHPRCPPHKVNMKGRTS